MVGLAWHQSAWKLKNSSNGLLFFNGKHSYSHQNRRVTEKCLFTVKKARKMLPFSLKFTGNNTVPTQQQISELAAAPLFWVTIWASITLPLRKTKKLPLNAICNQHLQPDSQPAWRNKTPVLSWRSGRPTTVKASASHWKRQFLQDPAESQHLIKHTQSQGEC